ncbi:MAG: helix-turn-helix domain-containing protein [Oscillospiraceae bacterium]
MNIRAFYEARQGSFDLFVSNNLSFYPHIHQQAEMVLVQKGSLTIQVEGQEQSLGPGELAAIFPNTVHSYRSDGESSALFAIYSPTLVGEYSRTLTAMRPSSPFISAERLHPEVRYVMNALEGWREDDRLLRGYLILLTGRILESLELERLSRHREDSLLQQQLGYIDEHFRENITLEDVAKALGVSRYHLSRGFVRSVGCSLSVYLGALRARYAESMLLSAPDASVTEVCFASGFDSLSTFYRAFRQNYGETPGSYKRRVQGM